MASYRTTTQLIEGIKRRAMIPTNQSTFQTADFLAFLNEELLLGVVPSILSVHEEFFVAKQYIPIVPNISNYDIPERAMGNRLRDLFFMDTQKTIYEMTRISPDDRAFFQSSQMQNRYIAFYLQGNEIIITPDVGSNPYGKMVATFYMRPNQLVLESRAATITSITVDAITGTTTYTVDALPTGMSASTKVDLIQKGGGHKTRFWDITPVSVSGTTSITFNTSDIVIENSTVQDIIVGDLICFAGETIIPQIPDEMHTVLEQRVATRCLEALGDQAGLQMANAKLAEMETKSGILTDNRVEGSPQKITSYGSLLRFSRVRRRGWI